MSTFPRFSRFAQTARNLWGATQNRVGNIMGKTRHFLTRKGGRRRKHRRTRRR